MLGYGIGACSPLIVVLSGDEWFPERNPRAHAGRFTELEIVTDVAD